MSSTRSYSKESRSYYSRSSSFSNSRSNSSYHHRPLSCLLIERESSLPSLVCNDFDDPYYSESRSRRFFDDFDRKLRWHFNDDFFDENVFKSNIKNNWLDFGRNIPINYRSYNSSVSATKSIPIQYATASNNRRETVYKNIDHNSDWTSNSVQRNNESYSRRENRNSTGDWSQKQAENPTRKRTTMTIFVRPPRVQYSDVPQHQRIISTTSYPSSNRAFHY